MVSLPSPSRQDPQASHWSARQLKELLERCPQRTWAMTSALMEAHDIRMCRRSSTR